MNTLNRIITHPLALLVTTVAFAVYTVAAIKHGQAFAAACGGLSLGMNIITCLDRMTEVLRASNDEAESEL